MTARTDSRVDTDDLESRVKAMYEEVALAPHHEFHFETADRWPSDSATRPATCT